MAFKGLLSLVLYSSYGRQNMPKAHSRSSPKPCLKRSTFTSLLFSKETELFLRKRCFVVQHKSLMNG